MRSPMHSRNSDSISRLMMNTTSRKPARHASNREKSMNMSFRIDRLDLLEAAEAAAHAFGHDHE